MFRPNRIGTPWILDNSLDGSDTSSWTVAEDAINTAAFHSNVINANPLGDFGRASLHWAGSARTLTASKRMGIGASFTVTQPLAGDTVGVELSGAIQFPATSVTALQPFLAKAQTTPAAVLASAAIYQPALLNLDQTQNGQQMQQRTFRTQAVIRQSTIDLAGTYIVGFLITEAASTPANVTFSTLFAQFAVRQLNDQQDIGYRDTLR